MQQLDAVYDTQRRRLLATASAAAHRLWVTGGYNDRTRFLAQVVPLVEAGQAKTVALLGAYMTQKARMATGEIALPMRALPALDYTIAKLRGEPAADVYSRPFGTIGARMADGATFDAAAATAGAYVTKLAATDLQLAQTHAAKDWLGTNGSDLGVVGYERVLGGEGCDFCVTAASRLYYIEDLMPIHDHCGCGVAPVFDAGTSLFHTRDLGVSDPQLGERLPTP